MMYTLFFFVRLLVFHLPNVPFTHHDPALFTILIPAFRPFRTLLC